MKRKLKDSTITHVSIGGQLYEVIDGFIEYDGRSKLAIEESLFEDKLPIKNPVKGEIKEDSPETGEE